MLTWWEKKPNLLIHNKSTKKWNLVVVYLQMVVWNERDHLRDIISSSMTVRELIRRASSTARGVTGLDVRDLDREEAGISIPPIHWPTEPPPSYDSVHSGRYLCLGFSSPWSWHLTSSTFLSCILAANKCTDLCELCIKLKVEHKNLFWGILKQR